MTLRDSEEKSLCRSEEIIYLLCLGCGSYIPKSHSRRGEFIRIHQGEELSPVVETANPQFGVSAGWLTTPVLTDLEMLAWVGQDQAEKERS